MSRLEKIRILNSCYRSCMELAEANGIRSITFCCISTGVLWKEDGEDGKRV